MGRQSKEDYINIDSDRSSKVSKLSKNDIIEMDKVLNQMQTAYRANIQAQQLYIDIVKRKNKNLNSNDIKSIYALFTQNKANQICYEKQQEYFINAEWDEKLLKRYYARVIQMGIRKISYYWMNSSFLEFLSSSIVKLMRQIYSCFNDIHKHKNLDAHFTVLKMIFRDTATIEQKIYQLLIDDGYLLSMDEFYRINGVDLVDDQQYQSKKDKSLSPSVQDSEEQIEEKKPSFKFIKTSKHKIPKETRRWGYSKPVAQSFTITPTQVEKNKSKIKTMIESLVTVIKNSIEQQKQNINHLEVIEEQNEGIPPRSQRNNKPESSKQLQVNQQNKMRKRVSKPQNILVNEFKKRTNEKKMSIQLMSYFSNEFKSAISETQQVDIQCLSQFLMTSESNSKQLPLAIGKNNNQPYIHSLQSLQSMKRIKQQKKRGKLIEMAFLKKHSETLSQMCEQVNDSCSINISGKSKLSKHKFSFKSAPGVYITLPKKTDFLSKKSNRNYNKIDSLRNRFIIKQNYERDHIFQNQLIVNQLTSQQKGIKLQKIDFTQVNGDSLMRGILGAQNLFSLKLKENSLNINLSHDTSKQTFDSKNKDKFQITKLKQIIVQKQIKFQLKARTSYDSQFHKPLSKNVCFTEQIKKNKQISSGRSTQRQPNMQQNKSTQRNNVNYSVYDRIRRKIIFQR